jgi:tetratricopeptide (TPR) repeat protein
MSQLLSQAQTNYGEGIQLINAGSRNLGITKFNEAREKTREVKLVYPVNQEAGLLELRMEQFLDPQGFNASFAQRLNTARAGARQGSWEAFGELQSLAAINPNYPGIAGIIRQAEIDMGLRRPDPNPADIARARELVTSASRVLDNNTTTQFEVALTWLDEAIRLDPNNVEAVRVKDRLLIRMGQGTVTVLSSQDEEQYQRAMREFQAGNHLIALSIVDRLLQNQSYRNVTRLTDLQSRIQASLR